MILFKTDDEQVSVDVLFAEETVWLTIESMSQLFDKSRSTINEHILNIFKEGELKDEDVMRKIGNSDFSTKPTNYYNLDVIISVGYRVKSLRGTQFRQWATKRLNEYIRKGFTIDDERLKNLGGGGYWKELLERIRDIRSSEKSFEGSRPHLKDAVVAKNYLDEKELRAMGQIVSGYLDFAERQAEKEIPMTMKDWARHLDRILTMSGEQLLIGNGTISHEKAIEKATNEYKKYQQKTLSEVETAFLESVEALNRQTRLLTNN
ncbi:MAG: RhuM family protein [Bacteroidia bacterium]|nr:RhuM family protein [Bacteroidia bacterium]